MRLFLIHTTTVKVDYYIVTMTCFQAVKQDSTASNQLDPVASRHLLLGDTLQ